MMTRQVGQLVKLTDELLDVSRITTGKVVLQRERVDLRSVVEQAIESSQPAVDAGGHQLRCALPPQPVWVLGDPFRLAQAVCNLLNNAAKYTPAGGSIGVHLAHEGEGARAVVRVSDTGAGIPPDMLERVFDLFTQAHRTMDRAQGGLGIGLSLVRHIVDLHGGSVFAESPGPERGSTFVIHLPLVEGPPAGAAAGHAAEPAGAGRSLRLLLVDDNADAADSLAILLESEGHQVRTEYSSAKALGAVAEFEPQVVLCDIGLPGMDGNAVARRIRADERHGSTVLVAVTGWGSDDDRGRSRDAGFDFHLVKPVSLASIREILAKIQR